MDAGAPPADRRALAPGRVSLSLALRWLRSVWRRWMLWGLLSLLVLVVLGVLVWLARGHEIDQVQRALERDNADALQVLRNGFALNVQDLHGLSAIPGGEDEWRTAAHKLLENHREWLRLEWRSPTLGVLAMSDSPYYPRLGTVDERLTGESDMGAAQACTSARNLGGPAYAPSHFVTRDNGVG